MTNAFNEIIQILKISYIPIGVYTHVLDNVRQQPEAPTTSLSTSLRDCSALQFKNCQFSILFVF